MKQINRVPGEREAGLIGVRGSEPGKGDVASFSAKVTSQVTAKADR